MGSTSLEERARSVGLWVVENMMGVDADASNSPDEITLWGLRGVGYKGSLLDFAIERRHEGWARLPFQNRLLKLTGEAIDWRVDQNQDYLPKALSPDRKPVFKSIIHAFCYDRTMPGSGEHFPPSDYLWITASGLSIGKDGPEGLRVSPDTLVDTWLEVSGVMQEAGLLRTRNRNGRDYLYLTKEADPILAPRISVS